MAESKTLASSSSSRFEQVRLVLLKLPDENIKIQVQQTRYSELSDYWVLRRNPYLITMSHILKTATHFIDSILLDEKETAKGDELNSSNILEFDSALFELETQENDGFIPDALEPYMRHIQKRMDIDIDKVNEILYEIDIDQASESILSRTVSWDEDVVQTMGSFVLEFVRLLKWLLHGPNESSRKLSSSIEAFKKNPVSIVGSPIEKLGQPIDQLNSLMKITLELTQCMSGLTLLTDTESCRKDIVSVGVRWAILSALAGHLHISLILDNTDVAIDLSHLISNVSHILNELKYHFTICKAQIEEMEAHLQRIAFFEDAFGTHEKPLSSIHTKMPELMKSFMYSEDGHQSLTGGSTMCKIDLEVLNEKAVVLFISDLDISTEEIDYLLKFYKEIREEDYYKIVWIPFVLKWTEELRQKFENLKSQMPWYVVSYDSPITGVWYIKGREEFFMGKPSTVIIDLQQGNQYPWRNIFQGTDCFDNSLFVKEAEHFPLKRLYIRDFSSQEDELNNLQGDFRSLSQEDELENLGGDFMSLSQEDELNNLEGDFISLSQEDRLKKHWVGASMPTHEELYEKPLQEVVNQKKPSSGFQGLLAMHKSQQPKVNPAHSANRNTKQTSTKVEIADN